MKGSGGKCRERLGMLWDWKRYPYRMTIFEVLDLFLG